MTMNSPPPKTDPLHAYWDNYRLRIVSSIGKWIGGQSVHLHDKEIFSQLMGQWSYIKILIFAVTGKEVEDKVADWLECNLIGLSYPDVRIWCNQISGLAASNQCGISVSALTGVLASDSRAYGPQTNQYSMEFIVDAYEKAQNNHTMQQIIADMPFKNGKPSISGFARPVNRHDERILPYERERQRLGIEEGPYLRFAKAIGDYLEQHFEQGINSGGYTSALLLDQGITPEQAYQIKTASVLVGTLACSVEQAKKPSGSLLPLQCNDIAYDGVPPRTL